MSKSEAQSPNNAAIVILEDGWSKFPTFFVDELMPISVGIPASFWKYLLVLWRDIADNKPGYRSTKTMTQFQVGRDAAMKWTAALSVSCSFHVRYGFRHKPNEPGVPTTIEYLPHSTREDWFCFITALRETVLKDRREHNGDVEGFRITLLFRMIAERKLHELHTGWLEDYVKNAVKKGLITVDEDGYNWPRRGSDRRGVIDAPTQSYLYQE
jgi:hypothetical protein